eukprot:scaffold15641_cov18-Tisochrysis_lutea.AAC.2
MHASDSELPSGFLSCPGHLPSQSLPSHLILLLGSLLIHPCGQAIRAQGGVDDRVLVHVLEQDGLADGGAVVHARAAVAMPAGAARRGKRRCCWRGKQGSFAVEVGKGMEKRSLERKTHTHTHTRRHAAPHHTTPMHAHKSCDGDPPNLEVERAVHAILLRTENASKMLRHVG